MDATRRCSHRHNVSSAGHGRAMAVALVEGPRPFTIALDWGSACRPRPAAPRCCCPCRWLRRAAVADLPGHPADVGSARRHHAHDGGTRHARRGHAVLRPCCSLVVVAEVTAPAAPQEARTMAEVKTMVSVGEVEMRSRSCRGHRASRARTLRDRCRPAHRHRRPAALVSTEERPGDRPRGAAPGGPPASAC